MAARAEVIDRELGAARGAHRNVGRMSPGAERLRRPPRYFLVTGTARSSVERFFRAGSSTALRHEGKGRNEGSTGRRIRIA
jgi:hypothetical protein